MLIKKITAGLAMMMVLVASISAQVTSPLSIQKQVPPQDAMKMETQLEYIQWKDTRFPVIVNTPANMQYILLYDMNVPKREDKTYAASELDQMPLFSATCLDAEDTAACSSELLEEYFRYNLSYPEAALAEDHDGLEKVMFLSDENGEIEGNIKLISKDKPCDGCAQAAVDAVAEMPTWNPGMVNGKPVKSKVILPIRFRTLMVK